MTPFFWVGWHVRNRKLETEKKGNAWNSELVDTGNKAAHFGNSLADASMYSPDTPLARKDTELYPAIYGVRHLFVLNHTGVKKLLDILDWRGSVKEIARFIQESKIPEAIKVHNSPDFDRFKKLSNLYLMENMKKPNDPAFKDIEAFLNSKTGIKWYDDLKVCFDAIIKLREVCVATSRTQKR
jgi:hypothetical protein